MQDGDCLIQSVGGGRLKSHFAPLSFNDVISLQNLTDAWFEFRLGKRSKSDVQNFEYNLEDNLFALHDDLKNKTYRHSDYIPFYITDPKRRHIHKANIRDRVLHHAIFRQLYPIFDKGFIFDSYSCRIGKGTHNAINRLEHFVCTMSCNYKQNLWALKCDVSKFFDSIDPQRLSKLIDLKISDPDVRWLIGQVLHSFRKANGRGIPLGNVTSQLFANIYLNELDQFMKRELKIKYYLRYCDDFIILGENREYSESLTPIIAQFLQDRLGLTLHPRKIIYTKLSQGIDFLGYVILPHHKVLRTKTKNRMLKNIQKNKEDLEQGIIDEKYFERSTASYVGMLEHCDSWKIKKGLGITDDV